MNYDTIVIGGGPAGLAASYSAKNKGAKTLLLEREGKLGGILKQCIHDGFGLSRFKEKLSGPEYAYREIQKFKESGAEYSLLSFVTSIKKKDDGFDLTYVCPKGIKEVFASNIVLATGCRERSSRGVMIAGTNPAGVMSAGQCQYYMNIMGKMPVKEAVILGSGDIGLIMARRITLEGGHVIGVFEAKDSPSGLSRNIAQCLNDFNIPLHLSKTVTRVVGVDRLEGVYVSDVDKAMKPIPGKEEFIPCDSLILSVGLIPENELASKIEVPLSPFTKGPECDQNFMTKVPHVYTCGNAMHVNDLADFVSESGEMAGKAAGEKKGAIPNQKPISFSKAFGYVVPTLINWNSNLNDVVFYFRVRETQKKKKVSVYLDGQRIWSRAYGMLRPPEMQKIVLSLPCEGKIEFALEDEQ